MCWNAPLNCFTQTPLSLLYIWKKNDLFKSFYFTNWKLQIKKTGDCLINACKCCSLPARMSLLLLGIFLSSNYNRSRQEILLFHDLCKWLDIFFAKNKEIRPTRLHWWVEGFPGREEAETVLSSPHNLPHSCSNSSQCASVSLRLKLTTVP